MNGLPVGRILGFEVRIHLSWVLILALVAVVVVGQQVRRPGRRARRLGGWSVP
jgi:hypothetical protein